MSAGCVHKFTRVCCGHHHKFSAPCWVTNLCQPCIKSNENEIMGGGERRKKLCSSYFPSQHSALFLLWKVLHVPAAPKWISQAAKVRRASERDCAGYSFCLCIMCSVRQKYICMHVLDVGWERWLFQLKFFQHPEQVRLAYWFWCSLLLRNTSHIFNAQQQRIFSERILIINSDEIIMINLKKTQKFKNLREFSHSHKLETTGCTTFLVFGTGCFYVYPW